MNAVVSQTFLRRTAILAGVLAVAAIVSVVISETMPSPAAPAIDVPLRSSLASLPESLGDWTRATGPDGAPIVDARWSFDGFETCFGTDVHLHRRIARDGRSVTLQVGYHSGKTLRTVQCTPEGCWAAGGMRLVSPASLVTLSSGLEVMLVEFAGPERGRTLSAYTFILDGKHRAERDTPGRATRWWTQIQLDGDFPPEDAATARESFLADVEDLMPLVVSELQNTCLPLPVEAVPTA